VTVHRLKTWSEYFRALRLGLKTCEIRKDDRGFMTGDVLVLYEFVRYTHEGAKPGDGYETGEEITAQVTHLVRGGTAPVEALPSDVVVMSLRVLDVFTPQPNHTANAVERLLHETQMQNRYGSNR
jgi:hypothetical protein